MIIFIPNKYLYILCILYIVKIYCYSNNELYTFKQTITFENYLNKYYYSNK